MKSYHDLAGDGGARVAEQVAGRRARIERRLSEVRSIVAVGSGKGGVGKSTVTMQLALALRAAGRSVAILDADLNGPVQARLGGLRATPLVPGPQGVAVPTTAAGVGVLSLGSLFPEPQAIDFDSVAEGDSHTWRATREFSALAELLESVHWGRLDALLVDLPPGAERTRQHAEFLGPRAAFVLVTIPSATARGVVARSVTALRATPNRLLGYVLNMAGYRCADCGKVQPLFPEREEVDLGIPCLGRLPFDPLLAELCDTGQPLDPAAPAAASGPLTDVATRLLAALEEVRP